MKEIVIYKFKKNSAYVKVSYNKQSKDKRAENDCLWLQWKTQEGSISKIGMRPDEALLIAEMLVQSVRITTEAYKVSKPIHSYKLKNKMVKNEG